MPPSPDDGDGLERRSLTGTARLRRANTYLLHAGVVRRRLPRRLARGRYVVAALRAACRSETGAPSRHAISSCGAPPPSSIFMPGGVRRRTREWGFLPVGASDRHRPPPAGERGLAVRTDGATPSASAIWPGRPYVVAALRAACRSETGAPSQRTIRSRGVRLHRAFSCPTGWAGGHAHGRFSRWGRHRGVERRETRDGQTLMAPLPPGTA